MLNRILDNDIFIDCHVINVFERHEINILHCELKLPD